MNAWARAVRANLDLPHRIACVTDITHGLDPWIEVIEPPGLFEEIQLSTWPPHMPQCLRRIAMFGPDAKKLFGRRFVSMDIDVVICGSLDPLFSRKEDIVLARGTAASRPYNGSMLMMNAGARPQVYDGLDGPAAEIAGRKYLGSDQAWVRHILGPDEAVWTKNDGVCFTSRPFLQAMIAGFPDRVSPRVVFTPHTTKPWSPEFEAEYPVLARIWRRYAEGGPEADKPVTELDEWAPPKTLHVRRRAGGSTRVRIVPPGEFDARRFEIIAMEA